MSNDVENVSLRQHMESILDEKDRALAMADGEREKAAAALRGEHQRAEDQAGREREKAAENLRVELARAIKEGDDRLREHIANQIMQINSALVSAEKLELERLSRADATISALSEKLEVVRQAAAIAQTKFEEDVRQRFANVNEFRDALDDLGKQMATRREMETAVANLTDQVAKAREERQHQIDDLRGTLDELRSRLDIGAPQIPELQAFVAANMGRREGVQASTGMVFGAIAGLAALLGIVIVLANVLTGQ